LGTSRYLLGVALLSVLIGVSASNSFQHVSASPNKEACVAMLLRNPEPANSFTVLPDAIICLAHGESNSGPCVSDLAQAYVNPDVGTYYMLDTLANAVICLAQSESNTLVSGACVGELVRLKANPKATMGELLDSASEAVICLARI
jgi:hypothetical protein